METLEDAQGCHFQKLAPHRHDLVQSILEEAKPWMIAGARALRRLPLDAMRPDDPPGQNLQD